MGVKGTAHIVKAKQCRANRTDRCYQQSQGRIGMNEPGVEGNTVKAKQCRHPMDRYLNPHISIDQTSIHLLDSIMP
jgi:hypothetical protein